MANSLCAIYWSAAGRLATFPWVERVCSKSNVSDEISRLDESFAKAQGWSRRAFDAKPFFEILQAFLLTDKVDTAMVVDQLLECCRAQQQDADSPF